MSVQSFHGREKLYLKVKKERALALVKITVQGLKYTRVEIV